MKLKTISIDELASKTRAVVGRAQKQPVLIRGSNGKTLILRRVIEDDLVDDLLLQHPGFRASLKAGMRRAAKGEGIPLAEARRRLGA